MMKRERKHGQVAIFLVLILAGLALLFALNVDVFVSSRAKIRLQNAADASALALARWQGITLNLIGELNLAHLAAVCQSNENAMAGIVHLQQRLAFIGPTIGFKAANDLAKENGIAISPDMTFATRLVAMFMDDSYRRMLDPILHDGIRAGVDNAAILRAGTVDPRTDPDFYAAIKNRDFRTLCLRYAGGAHRLPDIPSGVPDPNEILLSSGNACFGSVGIDWQSGDNYANHIGTLVSFARDCGVEAVTAAGLTTNSILFARWNWCIYHGDEWRPLPDEFSFSRFPWIAPLRSEYNVSGGSATIRVEGQVPLASLTAQTNHMAAQAAAKALGSCNGQRVIDTLPPLVLPSFPRARLVPFGVGAAGRYGMSSISHIRSMLGLLGRPDGGSAYLNLLSLFDSDEFRAAAEKWYSEHGHHDTDGCRPPSRGTERGGGTPYGI